VAGFIRFRSEPTGTCQNRQPDTVTGFLCRIRGTSRRIPARNGEFPEGFRRKFTEYYFRDHRPGYIDKENFHFYIKVRTGLNIQPKIIYDKLHSVFGDQAPALRTVEW
jgi:hypothetical protein